MSMNAVLDRNTYPPSLEDWKFQTKTLWYLGNPQLLSMPLVAVIGTRDVSKMGILRTQKLVRLLVKNGYAIVSGMANGVDTIAHQTALEENGYTIAVMGTPIDQCYPKENRPLKDEIVRRGLVLSQFSPGRSVTRLNFPMRNVLMAALSEITLVVEAGENSGTRYQVDSAIHMHRQVGFLDSQVKRDISWVKKALQTPYGFVIADPDDLVKRLGSRTIESAVSQLALTFESAHVESSNGIKASNKTRKKHWLRKTSDKIQMLFRFIRQNLTHPVHKTHPH